MKKQKKLEQNKKMIMWGGIVLLVVGYLTYKFFIVEPDINMIVNGGGGGTSCTQTCISKRSSTSPFMNAARKTVCKINCKGK